jgi:signal transduction histidine kinase
VSRIPIRLRLTLTFALVMAIVLASIGAFIYVRVDHSTLADVDRDLRAQAGEASGRLARGASLLDRDTADAPTVAQVIGAGGAIVESTVSRAPPLLTGTPLARVVGGATTRGVTSIPGTKGSWRLLAQPLTVHGHRDALVVALSLRAREQTLDGLLDEFFVGGLAALGLAVLAGYALAAGALRPVEAMRRRAAEIDPHAPGQRLPVAPARDELSRLAETLNRMIGRLEAAFEHERRFVDDASHELRTPLALLRTELELALRKHRSHEELAAALRSAAEETERLTRLAEDLLLIARSDSGELPIRPESLDAHALLERVADRFAARAREHGRLVVVDDEPRVVLEADAARLEQALENLVENALTHGEGAIHLLARATASDVELHVVDEGRGFPEAFSRRAFDRFSRADEARGRPGTGLGLAIVELIASGHGGIAGLANRSEGGADVWIRLPRVTTRDSRPLHPVGAGTVAGT